MNRDDDRREQRVEDYWYHRNRELDRQDEANRAERELAILRNRLGVGRRRPGLGHDEASERTSEINYGTLVEEKAQLLKQVAATFATGTEDELYRLLDETNLNDPGADTRFEQMVRLLEKRRPARPGDSHSRRSDQETFNILDVLHEQAREKERRNIAQLRVSLLFLRGIWRRYHSANPKD